MYTSEFLKQEWFALEKLHHYPPITLVPPIVAMTQEFSSAGLKDISFSIHEYNQGETCMYYLTEEWHSTAVDNLEIVKRNSSFLDVLHKESDEEIVPKIQKISEKILSTDLAALSTNELFQLFEEWYPLNSRLQLLRCPAWNMETPGEYLSQYLVQYLSNVIAQQHLDLDARLVFSTLTNPTKMSLVNQEHIEILELAKKVQEGRVTLSSQTKEIQEHAKKYAFLPFGCEGPAWNAEDIVKHIEEIFQAGVSIDFEKQIQEHKQQFVEHEKKQDELLALLPLDKKHKHLITVAKDIVFQKGWSKEHQYLSWYTLDFLLREMAKRLFITIQQMRYFLPHEVKQALLSGECNVDELNRRYTYGLLCIEKDEVYMISGEKAKEMKSQMKLKEEQVVDMNITEFFGKTAVPGTATGVVRIINGTAEMGKMQKGDILVSEMTIPEIVAAMKKASAVVTDMGGITCHAAIVSRELGIPCVIGTKIATKILKDGDVVEVDATKGIIKKI